MDERRYRERRKYPRVEKKLPIKAFGETFDFYTETMNIGAGGVLCYLEEPIPIATKLKITLILPSKKERKDIKIDCEGAVVRIQENLNATGKERYYIAIMFTEISPQDREKIIQFVNEQLGFSEREE
ncbi:MAG: PilZ domain-containing protein [Candidatus Omnitrophica bacterium]|nr:PilZ domain-containing protein [Candidatus Omnitrophota bacterium]MCM8798161.1 PilZ domain-containing protein [Candidatus Omnitrophota bacterium]